jgi:hypothetical protein
MKTQPLKELGWSITATASLYLSVVPFLYYMCVYTGVWMPVLYLDLDLSVRVLRLRGRFRHPFRIYAFAHDVTARS